MINYKNFEQFKEICANNNCKLVAVSKRSTANEILELHKKGQRVFGENRALNLRDKAMELPADIQWHFIGHLQRNKIKYILPYVNLIHSVDSFNLLEAINEQAGKKNLVVNCLLQFHIATESAKFGFDKADIDEIYEYFKINNLVNIKCCGVMGMATFTENKAQVRNEFESLHQIFGLLKNKCFNNKEDFIEISMGMSGDFELALDAGSTMLRVGSAIFN